MQQRGPRAIDIHAHVVPASFPRSLHLSAGWPSMGPAQDCHRHIIIDGKVYRTLSDRCWDVPLRLADMDTMQVRCRPYRPCRSCSHTGSHKRNPVALAVVLSVATRAPGLAGIMLSAMVQERERCGGGWHAEWETLPELCRITARALEATSDTLASLHIDEAVMRRNLDALHGAAMSEAVTMRLSPFIGRPAAHAMLERASHHALERNEDLLCADSSVTEHLSPADIAAALDPAAYLGASSTFVEQVLATAACSLSRESAHANR